MSAFVNEYDIDQFLRRFDETELPNLHAGAVVIDNLREWANSHSDGWCYWPKPVRSASRLITLLQGVDRFDPEDVSTGELRKALAPIKAFLTRQGVDHSEVLPS